MLCGDPDFGRINHADIFSCTKVIFKFYDPTSKCSRVIVLTDTQTARQTRRRTLCL